MISNNTQILLDMYRRSKILDDGWKQVSDALWPYVSESADPDLFSLDPEKRRIRLTSDGEVVIRYL